jgi:lipopolysaccharide export system permease protein
MLFLSIFSALFTIVSVVFLIKLATYTAVIQLSIWDMTKLYLFVIPELLFFTLPLTFFISAALTIFRLSNDNEIVVLFALGIHPKFIIRTLLKPALILSTLLLFNFFFLFPHAKILSKNFISYKKSEAKFNLGASEFGHKFGNWLVYLGEKNADDTFSNVYLFNKKVDEEILIEAKKAKIINDDGILRLKLNYGEGYSYSENKFTQIDFKTMIINDTLTSRLKEYKSAIDYWSSEEKKKKRRATFISNTLLSLFPVLSLFFILSISIVHTRHQQSRIYLYLFLGVLVYFSSSLWLQKVLLFYAIPTVIIAWLSATYYMYRKIIVSRF